MRIWNAPRGQFTLADGEIQIWRADVRPTAGLRAAMESTLSPDEHARAQGFRWERHRTRYILSHGILRHILSRYLRIHPAEIQFRHGPCGKPELADGSFGFSSSCSHDVALFAVGRPLTIGVDVERVRPGVEEDLENWLLPRGAARVLARFPRRVRRRTFFQAWARMEAYAKALGAGLPPHLQDFESFLVLRAESWIHDCHPRPGYVGALAVPGAQYKVRFWKWR